MGLTLKEKQSLSRETSTRYRRSDKKGKTAILNEFCQTTGYNRKYALHLLANWGKTEMLNIGGSVVKLKADARKRRKGGGRKPVYSDETLHALRRVWAFFGFMCGKLLAPLMRGQMRRIAAWPDFGITAGTKKQLMLISPSTIDRALKADRKQLEVRGKSRTKPGKLLRKHIPIRTHFPFSQRKPGFFEIDTVHHCGERGAGEYCLTLNATDVHSGWVELRPLVNKAHKWVLDALPDIKSSLPFALSGLDSDNGEEFINHALFRWCDDNRIAFTRTRPYKKNDNCFVEQKNDRCVRRYSGYRRYDTPAEYQALATLYRSLCPLLNYFLPIQKLTAKTRVGAKVKKERDAPASPYQRLLSCADISVTVKKELTRRYRSYNPVLLQRQVNGAVEALLAANDRKSALRTKSLAASALSES